MDICNVKQILTMRSRTELLWKSYLVCSDINERYDIGLLPRSSRFFKSDLGVSGFSYRMFFIFESSQLSEFSTDLQDSGL